MILECILVWRFMVVCCRNGSWCGCIARRIWNYHRLYSENLLVAKCLCDATGLIICYIVYVGPWVLGWKSLKPSRKTLRCGCMGGWSCPWVWVPKDTGLVLPMGMSPKRHRVWLALGWGLRIVIIILIEYLVEHWYLLCRLLGVSKLSVVNGWMGKSNDETNKPCLTWLHIC